MHGIMSNTTQHIWRSQFSRAVVALALAPAALVLLASIIFISFKATEELPGATFVDCRAIREAAGRLACYDAVAKEQMPMPAKGGQAIFSTPSEGTP